MTESARSHASGGLLLGADVGGTATRAALATASGEVLAAASGPAGNPNAVGLEVSAERIGAVVAQTMAQVGADRDQVRAVVVGLAGGARAGESFLVRALPGGLGAGARLVSDLSVAFSSATPAREGYVLVAGTGAVAGRLLDGDLHERRDGWGWLLGDEGSGFWLGREAVRATLARLQSGEPLGSLGGAVVEATGTSDPVAIVQLCYNHPPIWLASFAELVSRHADDPTAIEIAGRAARLLASTVLALQPRAGLPVVLAGSVATRPGPVSDQLRNRLAGRLTSSVLTADSGLVGALWLAAQGIGVRDENVHARFGSSLGRTTSTVV